MTPPPSTLTASPMARLDLEQVVSVHLRSFPGFFLSELGPRFLLCLYEEILADPTGAAFVIRDEGSVLGFVAGTTEPRGFYKRLLIRRWPRFLFASMLPLIRNPLTAPRLLNAFRKAEEEPEEQRCGLLMSIAVDPRVQAGGIGAALVHAFLEHCAKRGLSSVHLTTDRSENDRTNHFYCRLGFKISRVLVTPQGRQMNDYLIRLAPARQLGQASGK